MFPTFHGLKLAANAWIANATLESLAADPAPLGPARLWYNSTDKSLKFSSLDEGGAVTVEVDQSGVYAGPIVMADIDLGAGFTVVYITMSGEQFGTNLRATAAVSIPNMIRGALPLIILLFHFLRDQLGGYVYGGMITGALLMTVAIGSAIVTEETYGKDLDFIEE